MKDGVTQQFVNLSNIKGEIETNFKKTSL